MRRTEPLPSLPAPQAPSRAERWVPLLALAGLIFLAWFRRFPELGLYGDELYFFGRLANRTWAEEGEWLWYCLTTWPQGRPLGTGLGEGVVPHVFWQLGGLPGLHLGGYLVAVTNAALLHTIVRRVFSGPVAFVAAGLFALAPAATVQISLQFEYLYGLAILTALLATLAAVDGRPVRFALALAASLAMMEPPAMFALVLPAALFLCQGGRWRRALAHGGIWLGVVGAMLGIRRLLGDPWGSERVGEIVDAPLTTLQRALESAHQGTLTHARLLLERLRPPRADRDTTLYLVIAAGAVLVGLSLLWLVRRQARDGAPPRRLRGALAGVGLSAVGLLGTAAVYATYFRPPWHPATWIKGFTSCVHLAPSVTAALAVVGPTQVAWALFPRRLRPLALVPACGVLALLTGFGELVQRDYVASWAFQKEFWQAYRTLCSDAPPGTHVLVPDREMPAARYIERWSWGSELLLGLAFVYDEPPVDEPAGSGQVRPPRPGSIGPQPILNRPPCVIFVGPDPKGTIAAEGAGFRWKPSWYFMLPKGEDEQPRDGQVIVLERRPDGQGWRRLEGVLEVDGGRLNLRPPGRDDLGPRARRPFAAVFGL